MNPVYQRIEENVTYVYALRDLFTSLQTAGRILYELKISKPQGLDKSAKTSFKRKFKDTEKWFNETIDLFKEIPPYLDRPIKPIEIKNKAAELTVEIERFGKLAFESKENVKKDGNSRNSRFRASKSEYEKAEEELRSEVRKMKNQKVNFIYGPKRSFHYDKFSEL